MPHTTQEIPPVIVTQDEQDVRWLALSVIPAQTRIHGVSVIPANEDVLE
jgi:hypothetical protein